MGFAPLPLRVLTSFPRDRRHPAPQAMPALGLNVTRASMDALFEEFDPDGSGSIGQKELRSLLATPKKKTAPRRVSTKP